MLDSLGKAQDNLRHIVTEIKNSSLEVDTSSKSLTEALEHANKDVKNITEGLDNLSHDFNTNASSGREILAAV